MAVLHDIKLLKGIASVDTSRDEIINVYIRKSKVMIANYLNITSTTIETDYPDAVIEFAMVNLNKKGTEGIKQYSQGSRSTTYANELPDSVKALLPVPFVRMG
jgi:hypothetical protein